MLKCNLTKLHWCLSSLWWYGLLSGWFVGILCFHGWTASAFYWHQTLCLLWRKDIQRYELGWPVQPLSSLSQSFVLVKGTKCLFIWILTFISLVLSCDARRIRGSVLIQVDSPLGLVDVGAHISSSSFSPGSTGQSKHAWVVKSKDWTCGKGEKNYEEVKEENPGLLLCFKIFKRCFNRWAHLFPCWSWQFWPWEGVWIHAWGVQGASFLMCTRSICWLAVTCLGFKSCHFLHISNKHCFRVEGQKRIDGEAGTLPFTRLGKTSCVWPVWPTSPSEAVIFFIIFLQLCLAFTVSVSRTRALHTRLMTSAFAAWNGCFCLGHNLQGSWSWQADEDSKPRLALQFSGAVIRDLEPFEWVNLELSFFAVLGISKYLKVTVLSFD